MTERVPLTADEFFPFAVYAAHLEVSQQLGLTILRPPAPSCPTCAQPIAEIVVSRSEAFTADELHLGMAPCRHRFSVPADTAYVALDQARSARKAQS